MYLKVKSRQNKVEWKMWHLNILSLWYFANHKQAAQFSWRTFKIFRLFFTMVQRSG